MFNTATALVVLLVSSLLLFLLTHDTVVIINLSVWEMSKLDIRITMYLDFIASRFLITVLLISLAVRFFSAYYLQGILNSRQFHITLGVFVLSIIILITRPNLISLMIGWDGLGISSYLLVIFYKRRKSLNAGLLTGISNRVGDGLILVALAGFSRAPFLTLPVMRNTGSGFRGATIFILAVAACTKSAQIPFRAWLPAAIAAPTPVSALVHSSTLVTAGIYLLLRVSNRIPHFYSAVLANLGGVTILLASLRALKETDGKKIVALSTLSQLGVIMTGLSFNRPRIVFFHLLVHAFFKALLFIRTGFLIHNFNNYQNLRVMGGSIKWATTNTAVIIATKARLSGLPFFAAFYSKEVLLESLGRGARGLVLVYIWILVGVILTLLYSARFVFLTRFNYARVEVRGFSRAKSLVLLTRVLVLYLPRVVGGKYLLLYLSQYIILPIISTIMKFSTFLLIFRALILYKTYRDVTYSFLKFYRFIWALPLVAGRVPAKVLGSIGIGLFKRIIFSIRDFYWFIWRKPVSNSKNLLIASPRGNLSVRLRYFIVLSISAVLFLHRV